MKVKSTAECSKWSILQYFRPALSDNWSKNHFLVFLRVTVLDRFYCISIGWILFISLLGPHGPKSPAFNIKSAEIMILMGTYDNVGDL